MFAAGVRSRPTPKHSAAIQHHSLYAGGTLRSKCHPLHALPVFGFTKASPLQSIVPAPVIETSWQASAKTKDAFRRRGKASGHAIDFTPVHSANASRFVGDDRTTPFSKCSSMSPLEYQIALRIRRAMHLLESTDLPIALIAEETGFESHAYFSFSRHFHARGGTPPNGLERPTHPRQTGC